MNNSFEKKMKRVEDISMALESGEVGIDESIELFSEGAKLIKELNLYLDDAEKRVNDIIAGEDDEV